MDMASTDLLIIVGASLVVSPANSLVNLVPESAARVIFNRKAVGEDLGLNCNNNFSSSDYPINLDFFVGGECDALFLELIKELGWMDDLLAKTDSLPPNSILREAIDVQANNAS
jgi:NAD-dependent SIR2 family protein deacetylase